MKSATSSKADAKTLILDHAVRHFAEKGYDGVSLRELSRDAGLNTALVHYHFGGKEDVYRQVITKYLTALNRERTKNLASIDQSLPVDERIRALVRGYVAPHLKLCGRPEDHAYVHLLARFVVENDALTESIYREQLADIRNQYFAEIQACFPSLSPDSLQRVFGSAVMLMIFSPFDGVYHAMSGHEAWPEDPERLIEHVVNVAAAAFFSLHAAG